MIGKQFKLKAASLLIVTSLFAFLLITMNSTNSFAQSSSTEVFYVA
ncbi:MAG: hypothetical protein MJE63_17225 [Proteobacteria bacterium]|nr:hypothetical protein [Pseudomonadota bacterium]